jgi:hypothetical protein
MGRIFGKLKPDEINCSGNYKLPSKNGEVTNCRRTAPIEVYAHRGSTVSEGATFNISYLIPKLFALSNHILPIFLFFNIPIP